jgi:broad specificity phosphatase PhoE
MKEAASLRSSAPIVEDDPGRDHGRPIEDLKSPVACRLSPVSASVPACYASPALQTTVFLIRNAETAWNAEHRLAGRRELGLAEQGRATASALASRFAGVSLDELLASPLPRAVETAEPLAAAQRLEVARDPRLSDWIPGQWEGLTFAEIAADPRYRPLVEHPLPDGALPGGERLADVLARMTASVCQALEDNELGSNIAIVSHAGPLRLLLSHYLSIAPMDHERLHLDPGSVSVLRFAGLDAPPTLAAFNVRGAVLDSLATAR